MSLIEKYLLTRIEEARLTGSEFGAAKEEISWKRFRNRTQFRQKISWKKESVRV